MDSLSNEEGRQQHSMDPLLRDGRTFDEGAIHLWHHSTRPMLECPMRMSNVQKPIHMGRVGHPEIVPDSTVPSCNRRAFTEVK
jgi:hypothetical protein